MFKHLIVCILVANLCFFQSFSHARAQENAPYQAVVDIIAKPGKNRDLFSLNIIKPLRQNKDQLFFTDFRTVISSQRDFEGNIGLGYRSITPLLNQNTITGFYGFFDRRRSQYDKYFSQLTFGGEILAMNWASRFNVYQPISHTKILEDNPDTASLSPDGFVYVDQGITFEKGLQGYDVEYGRKIPKLGETWAHLGWYQFGLNDDNINVEGHRFRSYTQITNWLRLGFEHSHDSERGDNQYVEVRLRLPFGSFSKKQSSTPHFAKDNIRRYMTEPIVRDIDIVIIPKRKGALISSGPDGEPEKYYFVDNTAAAAGNGRPATPYNNLDDAIAAAKRNNTIFVRQGDGTTTNMDNGITLGKKNLRFIGSGVDLKTRDNVLVESATVAPHITNLAGDAVVVNHNGVEVAGFSIDNTLFDGVFVFDQKNANIHDNTIIGSGNSGIHGAFTLNKNYAITVENNIVTGGAQRGIYLRTFGTASLTSTVNNNVSSGNAFSGIQYDATNSSQLTTSMNNNITNNNGSNAGLLTAIADDADFTITLNNHTANNNNVDGIRLLAGGSGTHTITANNLSTDNNGDKGIFIDIQDSATATATLNATLATNNGGDGLEIISRSSSTLTASVIDHTSTTNGAQGVDIRADGVATTANITLANITATNSTDSGLAFRSFSNGILNVTASDINLQNNTNAGLILSTFANSSLFADISDITVENSSTYGLQLLHNSTGTYTIDLGNGGLTSSGLNRIFGNTLFDVYTDINGANVIAQNNWWGIGTGLDVSKITFISGGGFDSSNPLTSDPGP